MEYTLLSLTLLLIHSLQHHMLVGEYLTLVHSVQRQQHLPIQSRLIQCECLLLPFCYQSHEHHYIVPTGLQLVEVLPDDIVFQQSLPEQFLHFLEPGRKCMCYGFDVSFAQVAELLILHDALHFDLGLSLAEVVLLREVVVVVSEYLGGVQLSILCTREELYVCLRLVHPLQQPPRGSGHHLGLLSDTLLGLLLVLLLVLLQNLLLDVAHHIDVYTVGLLVEHLTLYAHQHELLIDVELLLKLSQLVQLGLLYLPLLLLDVLDDLLHN